MEHAEGLYNKYTVINNLTGQAVQWPAFVLNVEGDFHARAAILAYARSVIYDNPMLAGELGDWIERLNDEKPLPQSTPKNPPAASFTLPLMPDEMPPDTPASQFDHADF